MREVAAHGFQIEAQLRMANDVVLDLVMEQSGVWNAGRSREAMHPAQPGQTEAAGTRLPHLLVDVALFPAEATKGRVEAEPGIFAATEDAQPLHRDLERLPLRIQSPRVRRPDAPHLVTPDRVEMRGDALQIVVDDWPLQEVADAGVVAVIGLEAGDGPGHEHYVRVAAEHRRPLRFAEDPVAGSGR